MRLEIFNFDKSTGLTLHFEDIKCEKIDDGFYTISDSMICLQVNFNWSDVVAVWHCYRDDVKEEKIKEIEQFIDTVKNKSVIYMANAYGTSNCLLLSEQPQKIKLNIIGGGFEGHGTTAFIDNCPKRLLILGQND